ncbi:MAG: HAD family phosphatase [Clostridia bacterium]|nr:HAD family phosphatase [Clostridia bacterium]
MNIKGAIFDMDGTLLDSMDYWATVAEEYLQKHGINAEKETNRDFLEKGMKEWTLGINEKFAFDRSFEEVKQGINSLMSEKYNTVVKVKDGVREMLEELYQRGVKMCLATATDRALVESILKRLGIEKYFSRIFTTGEVGVGKSEPLIYELALEYLGTPRDETYIFEDAYYALKTAHNNGFKAVGVYDKNVFVSEDEIKALCDYYIDKDNKFKLF